ncbi:MalY/PatB family protein [Lacisediminihabitans changchengi]|uniref:cysteine-S-conjugate beta-lyase n=1 Tax=Lacisediminihabitans changchengi TaxID=2787634 RepID=A0A934SP03_9MICO|nr:aminotransferase class I/II-fold pyridoxal phosphate-dependent enzyme [Lacisediminihabitans changchengi]MBK4348940.1 aminotransferase class I/II-fold pyridoxal phosphate-dependent enzyme [Lacisediminihabitans changchengi]
MTIAPGFSLAEVRAGRSSVKWTRYAPDVIPLSVAEMDYQIAPEIAQTLIERVRASDFGYIDAPGPLSGAFATFADARWGWQVDPDRVRVTTDVSTAIVETLRYGIPPDGRVVINPPVYTAFYELIDEARANRVEVPLIHQDAAWSLDLAALERAFADGADAYLLCHPHNPLGLVFDERVLGEIARLAATYDVLVVSDEVHAPLTHPGVDFIPFLDVAAVHGARAVCVTSASKGWNLAGVKCALMVAGDARTLALLDSFPEEVTCRTSILGLHANVAAFATTGWLDETLDAVVANDRLLAELLAELLPAAVYHRPSASYLAWVDLRAFDLGEDPAAVLIETARVALNSGHKYGAAYDGFVRINLACDPEILREAIQRIAASIA